MKYPYIAIDFRLLEAVMSIRASVNEKAIKLADFANRHIRKNQLKEMEYLKTLVKLVKVEQLSLSEYNKNKLRKELILSYNDSEKPIYSPLFGLCLNYDDFKVVC